MRERQSRLPLVLLASVAVGAGFRLWRLGASQLNFDESFTALAGRMPLGAMVRHLRLDDSHPPFDYLLRAPLARAGVSATFIRLPSALCSIAALALFAYWMRNRGRTGVFATVIMALAVFQIDHGRVARMYAELELVGVGIAMVVEAWLRGPRRWHAPLAGALTALALFTHVSGMLLAVGLLLVPGRRTDRDAWTWRAAVGAGCVVWVGLWGRVFLVQARGGHSAWIPHSTLSRVVTVVASLVTPVGGVAAVVVVGAVVAGAVMLRRRDEVLARVWVCCFAVPVGLAVVLGRHSPVLIDRTLTLFAWAVPLAIAVLLDVVMPRTVVAGTVAFAVLVAILTPSALAAANAVWGPTPALIRLAEVARPGDIVAVQPISKQPELWWSLGVRGGHGATREVRLDIARTPALQLTAAPRSGRVWLLAYNGAPRRLAGLPRCAPDWARRNFRIECLMLNSRLPGTGLPGSGHPGVLSASGPRH